MEARSESVSYEACNKQGKAFALANRFGRDMKEYAELYMKSELASGAGDADYSYYQLSAPSYSLDFVDDEELQEERADAKGLSNHEAYWIGFFYRYFTLAFARRGQEIVENIPFDTMRSFYREFGALPKAAARDALFACGRPLVDGIEKPRVSEV